MSIANKILGVTALLLAILSGPAAAQSPASSATSQANIAAARELPLEDGEDENFASYGFLGTLDDPLIRAADGRVVWDANALDWVEGPPPASVHPGLWRHARLLRRHGLFRISERLYQVRGLDSANMTVVVGDTGLIILDALTTSETAAAALALVHRHLGSLPVRAIIYSHGHADHFGGAGGLVDAATAAPGVRIYAPAGFVGHAIVETAMAGPAMGRRAAYMIGAGLPLAPQGSLGVGIGMSTPRGSMTFIPPTDYIDGARDILIDGIQFQFRLTLEAEAPAELVAYLPQQRALWLSENANITMHNVLTPRGAPVRDAHAFASALADALEEFGGDAEVLFTSHGWPRFGVDRIRDFLTSHRNAYKFLHDQTVRMMNMGMTGAEIADALKLAPALSNRWFNRDYYGSFSFNVRAVYQRYMGWYDANPAHLDPLAPEQTAIQYVRMMGGAVRILREAHAAFERSDYRWTTQLLNHLVFAEPANSEARLLLAEAEEQLAYQSENPIWRNMYLSAAAELRGRALSGGRFRSNTILLASAPGAALFDVLAVRLNPERAVDQRINFIFPDSGERFAVSIRNDVLVHREGRSFADADATITLPRSAFVTALFDPAAYTGSDADELEAFRLFRAAFDDPPSAFAIVTPD